jgi:hypothetical protein
LVTYFRGKYTKIIWGITKQIYIFVMCFCSQLLSDAIIGFPEDKASKIISHVSRAPLFYYRFSYQGRYSTVYRPQTNIPYGMF